MEQIMHRPSLLLTETEIIEESKATILMAKVKELYQKLAAQISDNEGLLEENQRLKDRVSELESKLQLSQPTQHTDLTFAHSQPMFNLFIDKINTLQNENKRLRQGAEKNHLNVNQWCCESMNQNQNYQNLVSRRPSIVNQKMVSPRCSTSCFSNQQCENIQLALPSTSHYSPRSSYNTMTSKRVVERENKGSMKQTQIDRLWLSPNRKNLQKLISSGKNR